MSGHGECGCGGGGCGCGHSRHHEHRPGCEHRPDHRYAGHGHADDGCHCHCDHRSHHDDCAPGGEGGGKGEGGGQGGAGGTTVGWHNPDRPGHHCGTSTGAVPGGQLTPGNFGGKPPNEWPGQRADLYLPFLFMRANPGDLGARPVVGPFWESPDVLLLAGADPAFAPKIPPQLGQTALSGQPNTVYAHVWNFGLAQAPNVVVEFYWCDPSLGIGPGGAHLIGATTVALGARGSGRSHAVVKCPTAWVPTFVNGGHECLVVRIWDETSDGIG
ncbi:MAG: hypothetical protein QOG49_1523, partial [Frankiaceae bacterium]|nr:hypothetical protein [Frankiaceae bacterium]